MGKCMVQPDRLRFWQLRLARNGEKPSGMPDIARTVFLVIQSLTSPGPNTENVTWDLFLIKVQLRGKIRSLNIETTSK